MTTPITRSGKGSALTWDEVDDNFTNLNTYKYESGDSPSFAAITNGGVLATGFTAGSSYLIGMGAVPVQWDSSGTTYGYQLGSNAFLVNQGNTYTQLSHGMRVDSSGNQVYTSSSASPVWISLSGGGFYIYGAASGTIGNTISAVIPTFSVDTTTDTVTINNENVNSANGILFRNRLINGDFRIDQRNAGVATAAVAGGTTYAADRWQAYEDTDGGFTTDSDSTTSPPEGFNNYLRVTVTTADAALAAAQFAVIQQKIEGTNCADLDFGLSTAKSVTLSFRVRSSITGTFSGSLRNSAANRSYPFTYAISAANTWETKSITIAGDTTGTWLTTTGIGVVVCFSLGTGSTNLGTANAWAAAQYLGATGETPLMGTLNATWDITGVQFEVGAVATPFERRSYGTELALCQRYYYRWEGKAGTDTYVGMGFNQNTTLAYCHMPFPTAMRSDGIALGTTGTAGHYGILGASGGTVCSVVPAIAISNINGCLVSFTVAAGLTAGQGVSCYILAGASRYLSFSAEL